MKFWSILGNSQKLDGGAMFGNVPQAMWSKWIAPDAENRIPLACRALLIEDDDGRRILLETGIGAFFEPRLRERFGVVESNHVLLDSLAEAGFTHKDIDVVVLSHLHFDHAGGLLTPWQEGHPPRLLFPNARFVVGRKAFERARHPHPRDRASFIVELPELLEGSGRLELVDGARSAVLGDRFQLHFSDGHTPGLLLVEVFAEAQGGGLLFCADLIPGRPWVHLPVTMGYDRYPERLIDEKRAFLDDMLTRGVRLYFTHDSECAIAAIDRDQRGRYSGVRPLDALAGCGWDALPAAGSA
ncbi:MAG: MBL fold metallo-hydrolase [Xanthomonadales bacterium]|nr:MBL fold metallo-hydrolase [Xanthomonadales bacterium]